MSHQGLTSLTLYKVLLGTLAGSVCYMKRLTPSWLSNNLVSADRYLEMASTVPIRK